MKRLLRLVVGASALAGVGMATAATLKATLIVQADDARLERSRLERAYLGHTGGPASDGRFSPDRGNADLGSVDCLRPLAGWLVDRLGAERTDRLARDRAFARVDAGAVEILRRCKRVRDADGPS